jgi:hypothetical protein
MTLRRDPGRTLALALAATRSLLGATALVAPKLVARPWVGELADDRRAELLARALAGRDLALGLGALLSAGDRRTLRSWVAAGGLADAGDVLATLSGWSLLPRRGRVAVLAAAGAGAAGAVVAASSL